MSKKDTTTTEIKDSVNERHSEASEEVLKMTRAEALEYLGLEKNATTFYIDEKFWQLSKRYKTDSEEDRQKLADLSAAYDIATGARDNRKKALEVRNTKKKFLGKTSDEWANHFAYNWLKYVLAIVLIAALGNLCYHIFIKPRNDVSVVSLGHFDIEDDSFYDDMLKDMGYKNPYITYVNVVVPNEEGEVGTAYENQTATAALYSRPNVIVTDDKTAPYYFTELIDLSDFYRTLSDSLNPRQFSMITPVYCTEREFYMLNDAYTQDQLIGIETSTDYAQYSTEKVMIGLMITDAELIEQMGYVTLWDGQPNLVFGIYYDTMDLGDSEDVLLEIFKHL